MSVASTTYVWIPKNVYSALTQWADKAYPKEGVGLLIGRFKSDGGKEVVRFATLTNALLNQKAGDAPTLPTERKGPNAGGTEFVMDPNEFNRETLKAEKENLDVIGVVHTHPDHPPRPSQIDASQPFLAQWSNIIVAVEKGKTKEMKSWFRDDDNKPFTEEEIRIEK